MHATHSSGSDGALVLAVHRSIAQRPLIGIDPRQVVPIPLHILLGVTIRLLRLAIEIVILCKSPAIGRVYADELAVELRLAVRVEPTPYHGGVFIGRDCHAIAEKSDVVCATLAPLVPKKDSDAYAKAWELWRGVRSTLSRAAVISREESVRFRADTREFVTLLCRSFPWVRVSPKLHALWCHAPDFLDRFGSIGLYGEQGIEAWHGHMNQHADEYPAATELESASMYLRAMALARDASDSHRSPHTRRSSAAPGARRATKPGDGRLKENKVAVPLCDSTEEQAVKEGEKWAGSQFEEADRIASSFLGRIAGSM
eukprot:contig_9456_g2270